VLVHRKLRWLREPASLRPWLYRLATRQAFRLLRRRTGRRETQLTDADWALVRSYSVDDTVRRALLADQARAAIAHLPSVSRAVLSLHYLESMPLAEVAAVLDIPLGTAKSRLASGLERLRRVFGP
jgi:RNA polymerase sigma-70 factor (ECF subfamily)